MGVAGSVRVGNIRQKKDNGIGWGRIEWMWVDERSLRLMLSFVPAADEDEGEKIFLSHSLTPTLCQISRILGLKMPCNMWWR